MRFFAFRFNKFFFRRRSALILSLSVSIRMFGRSPVRSIFLVTRASFQRQSVAIKRHPSQSPIVREHRVRGNQWQSRGNQWQSPIVRVHRALECPFLALVPHVCMPRVCALDWTLLLRNRNRGRNRLIALLVSAEPPDNFRGSAVAEGVNAQPAAQSHR